ncbi:MAG: YebC/PmpR family DNA-binding transcriptional regulator [Candidatus Brennerbacteria bacterium]|nr:YebC/PmpR family DNA-binding transcriptional regulator [Candidatus Brennerbacteria bacterium]
MAGHSHWKQIKEQKGAADEKRGALFSKILRAVSAAARSESNPNFNPTLRTVIEKARAAGVPNENIARATEHARRGADTLEALTLEAYGPEGSAILIEALTDSKNRTVMEIKTILKNSGAKWAEPGSVRWAFESKSPEDGGGWHARFPQTVTPEGARILTQLVETLETHEDIQSVITNINLQQ